MNFSNEKIATVTEVPNMEKNEKKKKTVIHVTARPRFVIQGL